MNKYLPNKKEQLKNIENGKGIKYILDKLYEILGNPILLHDMEYKVIELTENTADDDPIWNEYKSNRVASYDTLVFFKNECFFYMAADAKKITVLHSDKLKYDRYFGKIFTNNKIQIGCACMVECNKPFDDGDPELFEIACDILCTEFCEDEFYQNYGQLYMETLIDQLIDDTIEDVDLYTAHIESLYIGLKSNIHLAVVDITLCDPEHTKLAYFRDLFKKTIPDFKYSIYSDYIVIIMSSDNVTLSVESLSKLLALFEQNNLYTGVSQSFEKIFELPKRYKEAVSALNYRRESNNSNHRLFLYNDLPALPSDK